MFRPPRKGKPHPRGLCWKFLVDFLAVCSNDKIEKDIRDIGSEPVARKVYVRHSTAIAEMIREIGNGG